MRSENGGGDGVLTSMSPPVRAHSSTTVTTRSLQPPHSPCFCTKRNSESGVIAAGAPKPNTARAGGGRYEGKGLGQQAALPAPPSTEAHSVVQAPVENVAWIARIRVVHLDLQYTACGLVLKEQTWSHPTKTPILTTRLQRAPPRYPRAPQTERRRSSLTWVGTLQTNSMSRSRSAGLAPCGTLQPVAAGRAGGA